ncbi:MAG: MarR family transcriptional regulator [Alphaproteobacteria bacterium]
MINTYSNIIKLIERLHRHYLDVLRVELHNLGIVDINPVQALLLSNIGDENVVMRDLKDRGYYQGTNVSYNIKSLTSAGYLKQERSRQDKRAVRLTLTDKGAKLCDMVAGLNKYFAENLGNDPQIIKLFNSADDALVSLERTFTDFIRFGRR